MSYADVALMKKFHDALKGYGDQAENVRPKWADGTPAHTFAEKIGDKPSQIVYNFKDGFPAAASRNVNPMSAIDEILWIYQKKSNNVKDLNSHVWDQWADKNGSIGKAYGYQVGLKGNFPQGHLDQLDRIFQLLKTKPADRQMVLSLWNPQDFKEMALPPCVWSFQVSVQDEDMSLTLNQRSNDLLAAGNWNVVQYAALLQMFAQEFGYKPTALIHNVTNSHVYDRHIPFVIDISLSRAKKIHDKICSMSNAQCDALLDKLVPKENTNGLLDELENPKTAFKKFRETLLKHGATDEEYATVLQEAQEIERKVGMYDKGELEFAKDPIDFVGYRNKVLKTPAFKEADFIVEVMSKFPEFDHLLGFSKPELVINEDRKFYNLHSPKMKNAEGKIVNNPDSDFELKNYSPQEEGIKLQARVPVAE